MGGISTLPPASVARAQVRSQSSMLTYTLQAGGMPCLRISGFISPAPQVDRPWR
jgi:hypothetical protein